MQSDKVLQMNSAKRLYDLFSEAKKSRSQAATFHVWIETFGLQGEPAQLHEDIGASCMAAIREELELLAAELEDRGCPDELFREAINKLRYVVSPSQFSAGWNHLSDHVGLEHLMALRWAGWLLDGEECAINQDERSRLIDELDKVIAELESSSVGPFTKNLMLRHLNAVRRALRVYRARGIEPVHSALNETIGAMTTRRTQMAADLEGADKESSGLFRRAADMINKVVVVAEKAQKVQKGIETGIQVAHQLKEIWIALPGMTT